LTKIDPDGKLPEVLLHSFTPPLLEATVVETEMTGKNDFD
jgi:hypothetical protein